MILKSSVIRNRQAEVEHDLDPYAISLCTEVEGRLVKCHLEPLYLGNGTPKWSYVPL